MPHRNRVLVIDDKPEDGEAIVRRLWKSQIPSFFLHYDEEIIANLDQSKQFEGIRVIFQDIALVSPDFPGHDDYAAAAAGINRLLADTNGPWFMIAWSTWGADPDKGDEYAKNLFEYLREHLPEGKKPYHFAVIDKRPYATDGQHGVLKTESELSSQEKDQLLACVKESISLAKSLDSLNLWEANIRSSASRVINKLWGMVQTNTVEEMDRSLGGVLFQLAQAQEGKRLSTSEDLSFPLYQILSSLLYDQVGHMAVDEVLVDESVKQNIKPCLINTMLHWDGETKSIRRSPGCIYEWPYGTPVNLGGINVSRENIKEFVIDAFVADDQNKRREAESDNDLADDVSLVIMDVTPACDHANNKAFWRKFLVGLKVPDKSKKHFYTGGKKLAGDYLKETPIFIDEKSQYRFIFNSKLILPMADKGEYISVRSDEVEVAEEHTPDVDRLQLKGRIREQLLQEVLAWFGGMVTRPGIVSLR